MKYDEAKIGRAFVIRLEDGDILHEQLEQFAKDKNIRAASVIIVGGADKDSQLIVGPEEGRADTIVPQRLTLDEVHEVAGTGTIFPNEEGDPILHLHLAGGRGDKAVVGCVRAGVKVWHVLEVIVTELLDTDAVRKLDETTGFALLEP